MSESFIETLCQQLDLTLTMKTSLKTLPPNIHWHFKKGKEKGVLEITLFTGTGKVEFANKKNRGGEWIDEVVKKFG